MNLQASQLWWQARPPREKLLVAATTCLVLVGLGDALLTAPLEKKLKRERAESASIGQRLQGQDKARSAAELREQEQQLRQRLTQLQADVAAQRRALAETTRLPETLRAITATVGSARLIELDLSGAGDGAATVLAGAPAASGAAAGNAPSSPIPRDAAGRRLYRLPITLKVAGSYGELQTLLEQIERHAQALQWTSLALDNAEWPQIQLTLKAHVLSTEARWGAAS